MAKEYFIFKMEVSTKDGMKMQFRQAMGESSFLKAAIM
jgi:hypothetical protein